jgi:hypothetical protein
MAQEANSDVISEPCELKLRLQLRKYGMRLERRGFSYTLLYGNQILISGNGIGEDIALQEIADFVARALVR